MDRDTIIRLAREAGAEFAELPMTDAIVFSVEDRAWNSAALHRFANLIEAHLREQDRAKLRHCMKVMQDEADAYLAWNNDTNATLLAEIAALKEYLNDKG